MEDEKEKRDEVIYYLKRDLEISHSEVKDIYYANYKLKRQNAILTILVMALLIFLVFLLFIIFR